MKKWKKTALTIGSYAAVAALAIGGTLAYLSDTDSDVNVMTMGNVKIEQHEYQRVIDENGDYVSTGEVDQYTYTPDKLQEFTQGKPALPAVYDGTSAPWSTRKGTDGSAHQQSWAEIGAPGSNQITDAPNVIDKFVFVENTGKTDAYYRTVFAVECPEGNEKVGHIVATGNYRFDFDVNTDGSQQFDTVVPTYITVGGVRYAMYVATYTEVLTQGEISRPSLLQIYIDKTATNEQCELYGDTLDVLVVSQAVQAQGFDSAAQALEAEFGAITAEAHPWVDGIYSADTSWYDENEDEFTISTANELFGLAELVNNGTETFSGKTVNLGADISLAGSEWTPIGMPAEAWSKTFLGTFDGNGYTISDVTVNNKEYAGLFGKVKGSIMNLTVTNAEITTEHYAGGIVGHIYGNVTNCTVEDSTIYCVEPVENPENGDKAGAIVGWLGESSYTITGCTAKNVEITANRDAGQIVGLVWKNSTVTENTIENVTVTWSSYGTGGNIKNEVFGREN